MTAAAIRWWSKISTAWQVLIVMGALFTVGLTAGASLTAYAALPAQVEENTEKLREVERSLDGLLDRIIFSNCMAVADAKGDPYQVCNTDPLEYLRLNK